MSTWYNKHSGIYENAPKIKKNKNIALYKKKYASICCTINATNMRQGKTIFIK